jgi:hypothetical protein
MWDGFTWLRMLSEEKLEFSVISFSQGAFYFSNVAALALPPDTCAQQSLEYSFMVPV